MYISCPSCSTSFNVDGVIFETGGRTVRCFNCSHTWHQYPTVHGPQAHFVPVQYVPPGQFAMPPQAQYAQTQPQFAAPMAPQQQYTAPPDAQYADPVESPIVPESPSEVSQPEEELPSEEELDAVLGSTEDVSDENVFAQESIAEPEEMSVDDLENLDDPEPIADIVSDPGGDQDDQPIEPEDIPDPDPFSAEPFEPVDDEEEEKSKGGIVKTIIKLFILLIVLGGIGAGAFLYRDMVVKYVPQANIAFDMIGFRVPIPGDGLKLRSGDPVRETLDGKEVTVIKGTITNVSKIPQPIPEILVRAIDAAEQVVQTQTIKPSKYVLAPGKSENFKGVFKNLPKTARRLDITFGNFIKDPVNATGDTKGTTGESDKSKKDKTPKQKDSKAESGQNTPPEANNAKKD